MKIRRGSEIGIHPLGNVKSGGRYMSTHGAPFFAFRYFAEAVFFALNREKSRLVHGSRGETTSSDNRLARRAFAGGAGAHMSDGFVADGALEGAKTGQLEAMTMRDFADAPDLRFR